MSRTKGKKHRMANESLYPQFINWLKIFLKDRGSQPTQSGFKFAALQGKHDVSAATGQWADPGHSQNKPQRWLFHIGYDGAALTAKPAYAGICNIGIQSTGQGDKAALVVRILPVLEEGPGVFSRLDAMEVYALFNLRDPIPKGGNADPTAFDPATGEMKHRPQGQDAHPQPYIFAGLLGIHPPAETLAVTLDGQAVNLAYNDLVNAIASAVQVAPTGGAAGTIPIYDLTDDAELVRLRQDVEAAYNQAGPPVPAQVAAAVAAVPEDDDGEEEAVPYVDPSTIQILEEPTLVGVDPAVYRQINAALHSGKQHIMFYGPPGTGKTTLARWVATSLTGVHWTMITGSADWSSQDIVGGYQPVGGGSIKFFPGVLLRDFDRPLIIDELNRCDIDKVIGPLFTVLSGQQTSLPYRIDAEDPDSAQFVILPKPTASPKQHEYAPGPAWRLLATINSIDKASLYQMSYALSRRFGWVYVDVPKDTTGFMRQYFQKEDPTWTQPPVGVPCPLGEFWAAINGVRPIGSAPILDAVAAIRVMVANPNFFEAPVPEMRTALLDAIDMVLLPMLDGIIVRDAEALAEVAIKSFALEGDEQVRIKERMKSVAV